MNNGVQAAAWLAQLSERVPYLNALRSKTPVFVIGCQRSGTTMLLNVLSRSAQVRVYHEVNMRAFDEYTRLRPQVRIQRLISRSSRPIVLFKPLNDSQHADRLLEMHNNTKAVWVYRNYQDVVNSELTKWNDVPMKMMYEISTGKYTNPFRAAMGERLSKETEAIIKRLCDRGLSSEDGAALLWYVRNNIYFDLGLQHEAKVLLCKYEDLVTENTDSFQRVFQFVGAEFSPGHVANVHNRSVGKTDPPVIDPEVRELCEQMMGSLNQVYDRQLAQWRQSAKRNQ